MNETTTQLRQLAEPWAGGEKIKVVIGRAAKRAGLGYWRAFDIWYGKARRVEDFERDAIAEALERKQREAARNELHELRARLERLESLLVQSDPDFHRPSIDAARGQVRTIHGIRRTSDSSMD